METVASDNETRIDALLAAVLAVGDVWRFAIYVMERNVSRLIDNCEFAIVAGIHEIAGQLGLAVDHDLCTDEIGHVDADQALAVGKIEAIVRQAFGHHPTLEAKPLHQVDGYFFENPCPDPAENICAGLTFEHYAVDALCLELMTKQEAGRPCPDNADLYLHLSVPFPITPPT